MSVKWGKEAEDFSKKQRGKIKNSPAAATGHFRVTKSRPELLSCMQREIFGSGKYTSS